MTDWEPIQFNKEVFAWLAFAPFVIASCWISPSPRTVKIVHNWIPKDRCEIVKHEWGTVIQPKKQ